MSKLVKILVSTQLEVIPTVKEYMGYVPTQWTYEEQEEYACYERECRDILQRMNATII